MCNDGQFQEHSSTAVFDQVHCKHSNFSRNSYAKGLGRQSLAKRSQACLLDIFLVGLSRSQRSPGGSPLRSISCGPQRGFSSWGHGNPRATAGSGRRAAPRSQPPRRRLQCGRAEASPRGLHRLSRAPACPRGAPGPALPPRRTH